MVNEPIAIEYLKNVRDMGVLDKRKKEKDNVYNNIFQAAYEGKCHIEMPIYYLTNNDLRSFIDRDIRIDYISVKSIMVQGHIPQNAIATVRIYWGYRNVKY